MNRATPTIAPAVSLIPVEEIAADQAPLIEAFREAGSVSFQDVPLQQSRTNYLTSCTSNGLPPEELEDIRDIDCPVGGGTITLRHYRPATRSTAQPTLVFLHGGGWVIGDLDSHDRICRYLAKHTGMAVIAVGYRLAPEHRFPVPLEDCREALAFIRDNARALNLDPHRLVVVGDSAGGNLATVLANLPQCAVAGTTVIGQVLLYPVTDLAAESRSYGRITAGFPLTAASMRWFADQYLEPGTDPADPRISPCRYSGAQGPFPPAFVVSLGLDPLGEEGIAYAGYLARHGTQVEHHHLPHHAHGIFTAAGRIPSGKGLLDRVAAFVCGLTVKEDR
ncbi:MAG: alpha/beta hydrolase [Arthrobacter sp.]